MFQIAISNIAWQADEDSNIFEVMAGQGIHGLEISPFRESDDVSIIGKESARRLLQRIRVFGIRVVALQALLFRFPAFAIFADEATRENTRVHLQKVMDFARLIGAGSVIFGSPKNKLRGKMSYNDAFAIAVRFFGSLAQDARPRGVTFCLEPTPEIFGADFIRNTDEAMELIQTVGSDALRLNLDLGALVINGEDPGHIIRTHARYIGHVHVSEPHLRLIHEDKIFHHSVARALRESAYNGIVSVEMLPQASENAMHIAKTLSFVKSLYV